MKRLNVECVVDYFSRVSLQRTHAHFLLDNFFTSFLEQEMSFIDFSEEFLTISMLSLNMIVVS